MLEKGLHQNPASTSYKFASFVADKWRLADHVSKTILGSESHVQMLLKLAL